MSRRRSAIRRRARRARRVIIATGVASVATPISLAIALTGVDALRKRRTPDEHSVPPDEPLGADVDGNDLTTYTYGEHLFEDMLAAIDAATDFVYLVTYIWKGDQIGQRFKDAVIRAAERGVTVCVVFDGFANLVVPREFKTFPESVHLLKFPTIRSGLVINVRRTGRDHRKVLVVDGKVGFVGGYNIGDMYARTWRDTHIRVRGVAVWELQNTFVDFWNRHGKRHHPTLEDSGSPVWNSRILAARNEPSRLVFPVRGIYLEAIDRATQRIWITQGYFIPDREIMGGLLAAARRGVDIRVLMPEASNHVVADWVARSQYTKLLEGGVRIFLYQDVMVHAKTATVDGTWTTVGTANIDRLSLIGNYEVNLEIHDVGQADQMERIFRRDLENARELTLREWESRGRASKLAEWILEPLHPLL
ncbi:phospholipase D-like domain-containing protein [Ornithinimicrobium cryptoxanthini]|uniref:Phospholipase D-like domain-containing protein n=1 Tax=Ornithinimicrobium cryptoxanthini TaxID=2934161 RepID=A0ABY4YKM6_9MICO|nr:phospholipase D-like domain-containing protein [Ornithinimicrobium cryptoxanthini]USQ77164.1 phospholipase D-like domain-containing protein [Ornithinimicrobium cryptoxanthini]